MALEISFYLKPDRLFFLRFWHIWPQLSRIYLMSHRRTLGNQLATFTLNFDL